jgi:hypothetical protein
LHTISDDGEAADDRFPQKRFDFAWKPSLSYGVWMHAPGLILQTGSIFLREARKFGDSPSCTLLDFACL